MSGILFQETCLNSPYKKHVRLEWANLLSTVIWTTILVEKKHEVNNSRAKRRQKGKQNEAKTGLIVALLHDSAKQST